MHFPDSILPPVAPTTDRTEITPKSPISPSRKVVPGFEDVMSGNAGTMPALPERKEAEEPDNAAEAQQYSGEERRKMCRRIHHIPVLLDTRTGEERRKNDQLGEQPATHMDRSI